MVHPVRLETITRLLGRTEIGDRTQLTVSTENLSGARDREDRHHVRTVVPCEVIDHSRAHLTSGPKDKRTAHPGKEVATSIERDIVTPTCIVGIQTP